MSFFVFEFRGFDVRGYLKELGRVVGLPFSKRVPLHPGLQYAFTHSLIVFFCIFLLLKNFAAFRNRLLSFFSKGSLIPLGILLNIPAKLESMFLVYAVQNFCSQAFWSEDILYIPSR